MTGQPRAKLFYKIGEVSRLAGVEPYILRYWEGEFPALSPRKNHGGQRVYQQKDLDLVLTIKRMLHEEGYTIAGARKALAGATVSRAAEKTVGIVSDRAPEGSKVELADALGRFKEEIKDILELIK